MKVTKQKAAEHRAAIVRAASRMFRERGFDGVGVAEITHEAGLTHGGFYGHFASKDALAAEACAQAFAGGQAKMAASAPPGENLVPYLERYLTKRHRDRCADGCPMAAYGSDIVRQDKAVQARFAEGAESYIRAILERLPATQEGETGARRERAITILAAMVGGLTLSRATAKSDPELSAEILASVRTQLAQMAEGSVT
jgi:TetR/AcrR family transcriptional regulator, transcriptional repressor for nem operon